MYISLQKYVLYGRFYFYISIFQLICVCQGMAKIFVLHKLKYFQGNSWLVGVSLGVRDIFPPKVIVCTAVAGNSIQIVYYCTVYLCVTWLGGASLGDSFKCAKHTFIHVKVLLNILVVGLKCLLLWLHVKFWFIVFFVAIKIPINVSLKLLFELTVLLPKY